MRRWGLAIALLLSVGMNLGILGSVAVQRLRADKARPGAESAPVGQPPEAAVAAPPDRPAGGSTTPIASPPVASPEPVVTELPAATTQPVADRPAAVTRPRERTAASPPRAGSPGEPRLGEGAEEPLGERRPGRRPGARPPAGQAMGLPPIGRLADRLGLEGKAREKFVAQQRQFFVAMSRDRLRLDQVHRQLRRELVAGEPDPARIDELLQQASQAYQSLERSLVDNVLASREILDPAQERMFINFVSRLRPLGGQPAAGARGRTGVRPWTDEEMRERLEQRRRRRQNAGGGEVFR